MEKRLTIGRTYRVTTEGFKTWAKEGHEPGGVSQVAALSEGNTFTVLSKRPRGGGWYEAQVNRTERYEPQYGGPSFSWRGVILVSAMFNGEHFKIVPKEKGRARA